MNDHTNVRIPDDDSPAERAAAVAEVLADIAPTPTNLQRAALLREIADQK